jgi:hypothetical protein
LKTHLSYPTFDSVNEWSKFCEPCSWLTNQWINVEKCSNVEHKIEQPIGKHLSIRLGVPIAKEKTEDPMTKMEYLGLTLDTIEMCVQIPDNKVQELLKQITPKRSKTWSNVFINRLQLSVLDSPAKKKSSK